MPQTPRSLPPASDPIGCLVANNCRPAQGVSRTIPSLVSCANIAEVFAIAVGGFGVTFVVAPSSRETTQRDAFPRSGRPVGKIA